MVGIRASGANFWDFPQKPCFALGHYLYSVARILTHSILNLFILDPFSISDYSHLDLKDQQFVRARPNLRGQCLLILLIRESESEKHKIASFLIQVGVPVNSVFLPLQFYLMLPCQLLFWKIWPRVTLPPHTNNLCWISWLQGEFKNMLYTSHFVLWPCL